MTGFTSHSPLLADVGFINRDANRHNTSKICPCTIPLNRSNASVFRQGDCLPLFDVGSTNSSLIRPSPSADKVVGSRTCIRKRVVIPFGFARGHEPFPAHHLRAYSCKRLPFLLSKQAKMMAIDCHAKELFSRQGRCFYRRNLIRVVLTPIGERR